MKYRVTIEIDEDGIFHCRMSNSSWMWIAGKNA